MRKLAVAAAVVAALGAAAPASARTRPAPYFVGAAKADITPTNLSGVYLGGYGIGPVHPAKSVLRLMDALEDHDDVEAVYANFDIPDAVLEAVSA